MEYLANVLPVDPKSWTLNKATMTKNLIKLESNGTASTTLTHDQVQFTPKAFKVTVKFIGEFDEFSPAAFAKLLIKDNNGIYQVFTAPFQVTSKTSGAYFMQAELYTDVADFKDMIFQFNTEEYVEITEWKLYPSSDVDSNTLNTIESMLPQFLSTFNENAITIGSNETEIVNLPFAMGEAGNLSCHLLFSYVVEASCKMIVTIKVDGSAEPYTPIVMQVQEGPGFVGIPHSFLQVQAAAHLVSVTVKLEAYESAPADGALKASIQAKAVRYTCEGRGILNGQGGEYPHAEVSETYEDYPALKLGLIQCSTTCEVTTSEYTNVDNIERYTYPGIDIEELGYTADIPIADVKAFGATEYWTYNSSKAEAIHITGNLSLTSTGLTFENGVGEGIATYDVLYPTESYVPLINCVEANVSGTPNMKVTFSTNGSSWFTIDENKEWQPIELTVSALSQNGISLIQLATLNSDTFKKLFELGGANKLTIAVYMVSSIQQMSFTLNSIAVYYSTDESNLPLNAPLLTFAIAEDSRARVHWQPPTGQPRAVKVYYGSSVDFGQSVQSDVGATFCEIPGLDNRTKYYFAAATLGYGRESEKSNVLSAIPTTPVPRFLLCEADISKITIQWQIVGAVYDSYNIYLGTSEDNLVLHTNTTEMQAVLENLQNNVEYFVALTGVKASEESWFSEIRTARPLLPVLKASRIVPSKDGIEIRVALPDKYAEYTGFVKYRVYYGTTIEDLSTYVESADTTLIIPDLTVDTLYYLYITGLTALEESTPSSIYEATTADKPTVFETAIASQKSFGSAGDYTGETGWEFKALNNIDVWGFRVALPKSEETTISLYEASTGSKLATATTTAASGKWVEVTLDAPITLEAGRDYVISATCTTIYCYNSATSSTKFNSNIQYVTARYKRPGNGTMPSNTEANYLYPHVDILFIRRN